MRWLITKKGGLVPPLSLHEKCASRAYMKASSPLEVCAGRTKPCAAPSSSRSSIPSRNGSRRRERTERRQRIGPVRESARSRHNGDHCSADRNSNCRANHDVVSRGGAGRERWDRGPSLGSCQLSHAMRTGLDRYRPAGPLPVQPARRKVPMQLRKRALVSSCPLLHSTINWLLLLDHNRGRDCQRPAQLKRCLRHLPRVQASSFCWQNGAKANNRL